MPRTTLAVCDSDDYCLTPGQRRKVNVHYHREQPVLYVCKGCARQARKANHAKNA
jgi:hypothetical protein